MPWPNSKYSEIIETLVAPGEEVQIVGPAGFAYEGRLMTMNRNVFRLQTSDGKHEILLNPDHVVSVRVILAEA